MGWGGRKGVIDGRSEEKRQTHMQQVNHHVLRLLKLCYCQYPCATFSSSGGLKSQIFIFDSR